MYVTCKVHPLFTPNLLYFSGIYYPYTCATSQQIVSLLPVFLLYVSNIIHCPYGQALRSSSSSDILHELAGNPCACFPCSHGCSFSELHHPWDMIFSTGTKLHYRTQNSRKWNKNIFNSVVIAFRSRSLFEVHVRLRQRKQYTMSIWTWQYIGLKYMYHYQTGTIRSVTPLLSAFFLLTRNPLPSSFVLGKPIFSVENFCFYKR